MSEWQGRAGFQVGCPMLLISGAIKQMLVAALGVS